MTSQTDRRDCVTNITYDELNRPTGKTYSNCPSTPSVTYTYDAGTNGKGRRTSMSVTGADYTQWIYDERGRVTSENKQITDGGQFVTAFTYNLADLPVTMTYPGDNETVTFKYNDNMLVEKVFNEMGTPENLADDINYAQSIAYDSAMRMIQLVRGTNVINTVFDYNDWNADGGRLLNLTSTQVSTGDSLQNLTYDYDSVGNINMITDTDTNITPSVVQTQTFTYDELDRLISSDVSGGANGTYSEDYTYETSTGNLKTKGNTTPNTYTYDTTHKHAVASLSNGNTYGYDDNGNMTSRNVGGQSFTLNYDAENRLVSVTGAATANFTYDGDGKQIKATVNGTTTVYVGNHYEVKNSVVTKYYFAGTTRLAVRTGGTLSFLLGDHLGSSSVTTDANGAKTASALYKAFGETRYTLGNLGTDYKFTGQREEASLGIYFFNARWYDSSLGRFLSPDSIVPTSTQGTQAWDRYAFVNNNPVRYTDPTGHRVTNDDGGTKYSYEQTQYDRQRIAHEQCEAGVEYQCSYGEQHPVEVATFAIGSFALAGAAEYFVFGGGLAGVADATMYQAGLACLKSVVCRVLVGAAGGAGTTNTKNTPLLQSGGSNNPRTGPITSYPTSSPTSYFRYWNTNLGNERGSWVTTLETNSGAVAQDALSLPYTPNAVSRVFVPSGFRVQDSLASSLFGNNGFGPQTELLGSVDDVIFQFIGSLK